MTPKGLTVSIPCTVKSPSAETTQRWEQVLKNTSYQLMDVLLNHYSSVNSDCEEKLTMLHMETSNTIQDEQDESKSQRLQHRLELVQELALQNIAVHRQKLAAAQRKKLIAAKIIQEDNPPDPKGLAPPEKKEEDSKILSLLQELSNRLSRLEGAENKPSPKQHRERFHPYPPQFTPKRGRGGWRGRPPYRGGRGGRGRGL